ncbi:MAG: pantoate kinase [Halobacteriales archaeon]
MTDATTVRVPGHVTLLFSVHEAPNAAATGSRGVGLTTAEGVTVRIGPGQGVRVNGERRPIAAVEGVLEALGVEAAVDVETALPLGTGFGVSGAAALGTAFAANRAFGCELTENALVRTAHVAEVEAGTGLGDVVAQAHGGVVLRLEPGAPPHGRIDAIPEAGRLEYLALGELSTPTVLAGDTAPITAAGDAALEGVLERPTLSRSFARARAFAEETGLLDDEVAAVIEAVEAVGGTAAMAMLGRTVVALDDGLSRAGYDAVETAVDPHGARFVEDA